MQTSEADAHQQQWMCELGKLESQQIGGCVTFGDGRHTNNKMVDVWTKKTGGHEQIGL